MASEFIQRQKDDFFRDVTSFGSLWFYVIAVLVFLILGNYGIFRQLTVGVVLIYAITIAVRTLYFKNRPEKYGYSNFIEKLDASAFPSLHSARIAFLSGVFMNYFNNVFISIILVILAILVAYARVYLKKHDAKDVFAGIIFGIVVYYVVRLF